MESTVSITTLRVTKDTADKLQILKRRLHVRKVNDVIEYLIAMYVKYEKITKNCPELVDKCEEKVSE